MNFFYEYEKYELFNILKKFTNKMNYDYNLIFKK